MNNPSNTNSETERFNGTTRRNYLRAAGTVSITGLGLSATLGQAGAASDLSHTVIFAGNGTYSSYTVTVSGDLEAKKGIGGVDSISGSTATGAVGSGNDVYNFSGTIADLTIDGNATVYLDGEPVDTNLDHTLVVEGTGSYSSYEFSVTGEIGSRQGIAGVDNISGSTATGAVGSGSDSYGFSGHVTSMNFDGDAEVYIDGEPINMSFDHTLTVEGTGSYSSYEFSVTGEIGSRQGIAGVDDISGSTATGAVGSGNDVYNFSGTIADLTIDGNATVYLDGEPVDTNLDHTLLVEATGPYSTYGFSVSGSVCARQGIAGRDSIDGPNASGAISGDGRDSYGFSGTIRDFGMDGDASVYRDGEQIVIDHTGFWRETSSMPVAQGDLGGAVLDDQLYVFGGFRTGTGLDAVKRAFVYDPTRGTDGVWSRIEDLPRALWAPCGVAGAGKLFSFGGAPPNSPYGTGDPPSDAILRYTPDNGWTDLTATRGVHCPYRNWAMGGIYNPNDGLIYCVGGATVNNEDESRIWTFDPEGERVADPYLARLPEAKRWHTVALVEADGEHCVHAIGGRRGPSGPTDSNLRYGISSGRTRRMQRMPQPGSYTSVSNPVVGNSVYLTHARFLSESPSTDDYTTVCHRYDPQRDRFDTDLPQARHRRGGTAGGVIDGTLFVVGGQIKRYEQNGLHDCVAHVEGFRPFE